MPNPHEGISIFQIRYVFPDFASPLSDVSLATDSSPFLCVSFSVPLRQTDRHTHIDPYTSMYTDKARNNFGHSGLKLTYLDLNYDKHSPVLPSGRIQKTKKLH